MAGRQDERAKEKGGCDMLGYLPLLFADIGNSVIPSCHESEEFMKAFLESQKTLKELQNTFTEKQYKLFSEHETAANYCTSIETDYGNEAIFLRGVEVGLMLAGYGKDVMK